MILDTHVVLWALEGTKRLGRRARRAIERAADQARVSVSAISFWEIAMLHEHGRLKLKRPIEEYRELALRGMEEHPVDGSIAIVAARLRIHPDPADRIIVATALERGCTLVTADEALLSIRRGPKVMDAAV